jgi:hypothetical protein
VVYASSAVVATWGAFLPIAARVASKHSKKALRHQTRSFDRVTRMTGDVRDDDHVDVGVCETDISWMEVMSSFLLVVGTVRTWANHFAKPN